MTSLRDWTSGLPGSNRRCFASRKGKGEEDRGYVRVRLFQCLLGRPKRLTVVADLVSFKKSLLKRGARLSLRQAKWGLRTE
jgi:hypothetical protein